MRRSAGFLIALLTGAAQPASAEPKPIVAPVPDWVLPMELPAADPERSAAPLQFLLLSTQTRYEGDTMVGYAEMATLIQDPQALGFGNLSLPWSPERGDLFIHKVHILRAGKTIDVLAGGQEFTVVRRETNLEGATLDGMLTAVLQPEGLSVGDILLVAFSHRRKSGLIDPAGENASLLPPGIKVRRFYHRHIWDADKALHWRATPFLDKARVAKTRLGNELLLDLRDVEAPKQPEGAPARYALTALLQTSPHDSWTEVSPILAPAYQKARTLAPASPLRAEAETIARATSDKGAQALAALRLVQDRLRYFHMAMGEAGFVPATADESWARKYGDCKDKTVTLLALLDQLGIAAEPVLVSTQMGDGLDARLPGLSQFDHVIVKATIDGKAYWLDGTRTGDRQLAALDNAPFRWGLPIRAAGADLEAIPLRAPDLPLTETEIVFDASAGLFAPVGVKGKLIFRGDMATMNRMTLGQLGEKAYSEEIASSLPDVPGGEDAKLTFLSDEATGTFTIAFESRGLMSGWDPREGRTGLAFLFNDDVIEWQPDFEREDGEDPDVPFTLGFPYFEQRSETILLPDGGKGFVLDGKSFDTVVAGARVSRTLSLEGNRVTAVSRYQRLAPEVSAADAKAAAQPLKRIMADEAAIHAPANYMMSDDQKTAALDWEPKTASNFIERGYQLMQSGDFSQAIDDFNEAIALESDSVRAHANKAVSLLHLERRDEAKKILAHLATLEGAYDDYVMLQAEGLLAVQEDRPQDAVRAFTRALRIDREDTFSMFQRASAYQQMGRFDDALLDYDEMITIRGATQPLVATKARLLAHLGQGDEALKIVDQALAEESSVDMLGVRAALLKRFGKVEESRAAFAKAIAAADEKIASPDEGAKYPWQMMRRSLLSESGEVEQLLQELDAALSKQRNGASLLRERCEARATANLDLALALKDCDQSLKGDPENPSTAETRGLIKLRLGRYDEAIRDFDDALLWSPKMPGSLHLRGVARRRKGDVEGGDKDLAQARALMFDIETHFQRIGIAP